MPQIPKDRRSNNNDTLPPTLMMQAVKNMAQWKKDVLFVVGIVFALALLGWVVLLAFQQRAPTKYELIGAGVLFAFGWWAIAPDWVTRAIDKHAPKWLRKDRRNGA